MIPSVPRCTCDHNCAIISSNLHKIQGKVFSTSMNYVWKPIALEMQAFNLSNVPFKAILKYFYCSICYQCFFLRIPRLQPVLYVCTNVGDSLTRFDNECQWLDNTDVVQIVQAHCLPWVDDTFWYQCLWICWWPVVFTEQVLFSINQTWCVVIWKKRCEDNVNNIRNHCDHH